MDRTGRRLKVPRHLSLAMAVLVALILPAATGCGAGAPAPDSGVIGLMVESGGPAPGSPRPVSGVDIEIHRGTQDGVVVKTARSGSGGTFRVTLAPGRYTLVPQTGGGEMIVPDSVVVTLGDWVRARVGFSVR